VHLRIVRVSARRWAARDERYPSVVGYGDSPDDAARALEEKLPRPPPESPNTPSLPLAPAHGLSARDLFAEEKRERTYDAMERAILVGRIDANRRRH
jgi:hypothetical protein